MPSSSIRSAFSGSVLLHSIARSGLLPEDGPGSCEEKENSASELAFPAGNSSPNPASFSRTCMLSSSGKRRDTSRYDVFSSRSGRDGTGTFTSFFFLVLTGSTRNSRSSPLSGRMRSSISEENTGSPAFRTGNSIGCPFRSTLMVTPAAARPLQSAVKPGSPFPERSVLPRTTAPLTNSSPSRNTFLRWQTSFMKCWAQP